MRRALVVLALAASVGIGAIAACSSSADNGGAPPGMTVYAPPDGGASSSSSAPTSPGASVSASSTANAGVGSAGGSSAGAGIAPVTRGSALCNASPASGCFPDQVPAGRDCELAPDGGADADSAGDGQLLACRVVSEGGVPAQPRAACTPAGSSREGSPCRTSADCAPTNECVADGVCRRYCCNDPCGADHFCDIQPETERPELVVPVCMPVRSCALLAPLPDGGPCDAGETCTPVAPWNGVGQTTCVTLGPAHEGDSCEAQHCAANLACIGMWGSKQCYKLCHTADAGAPECGPGQTCMGGLPLFADPSVGLCQQLATAVGPDR